MSESGPDPPSNPQPDLTPEQRRDDAGYVVDFHALRMTFITNPTRSGVTPTTAQLLARHSDINLTKNTYTVLGVLDQAGVVESLPPIPQGGLAEVDKSGQCPDARRSA